ncbi:TPA: DUF4145 domain-containing protein [Vibrio parahaemolyticus]|nr:DUF4145 domain-containing protein [Vibrio parahaemolyticus]
MKDKLLKRFEDLILQAEQVEGSTRTKHYENIGPDTSVDHDALLGWGVKVKNLLVKVGGENCIHFQEFLKTDESTSWSGNLSKFKSQKAILEAAKEDFEGGYMSSYKSIVQAEVFDNELEQATELLEVGYISAAAVIAGVVLETSLRELCDREKIVHGKLDKMNADLVKAGVLNKIVQKQITAYAGIRNSAAHGKNDEFSKADVEQMIKGIEHILAMML